MDAQADNQSEEHQPDLTTSSTLLLPATNESEEQPPDLTTNSTLLLPATAQPEEQPPDLTANSTLLLPATTQPDDQQPDLTANSTIQLPVAKEPVASGRRMIPRAQHLTQIATTSSAEVTMWLRWGMPSHLLPSRRAFQVFLSVLLVIGLLGSLLGTGITAISDYQYVHGLATNGVRALQRLPNDLGFGKNAKHLAPEAMRAAAQADVDEALTDFQNLHDKLANPDAILSAATLSSKIKSQLHSGLLLSNVALDAVHTLENLLPGIVAVAQIADPAAITGATASTTVSGGLTVSDIDSIKRGFEQSIPYLNDLAQSIQSTPPATLFSALSDKQRKEITPYLGLVPQIPAMVPLIRQVLDVAPSVLGVTQPTAYLLMTLDNSELRPSGGFQGNYAVVGVNGGHIGGVSLQDVYLLDKPYDATAAGSIDTPPAAYLNWWPDFFLPWGLRDANLSPDFPTSAQFDLQQLTLEGGNQLPVLDKDGKVIAQTSTSVSGVIAIEPKLIQQALAVTGPITLGTPYDVTVTPDNLQAYIHYFQLTDAGRKKGDQVDPGQQVSSRNKRFTALLAKGIEDRLKTLPKETLLGLVRTALDDFQSKDIQLYSTDPAVEALLQSYHATAAIYTGVGDSLVINQANISGNKGSQYLHQNVTDNVQLDSTGGATHTMTITYQWTPPPIEDGTDATAVYNVLYNANSISNFGLFYRQYVRIYTAQDPVVRSSDGWQFGPVETTQSDFTGHGMIGAHYLLNGNANTHPVTWNVPTATVSWHVDDVYIPGQPYTLHWQHQAGDDPFMTVNVFPPDCVAQGTFSTHPALNPLATLRAFGTDATVNVPVAACAK